MHKAVIAIIAAIMVLPPQAKGDDRGGPVGVTQIEFVTETDHRPLWMAVFYPAAPVEPAASRFPVPYSVGIDLHADVALINDGARHPLVMLSHGRGSDAWQYAWFAQALASRGYIVAALNHYHANSNDRQIAYLANRIWQRPVDISLCITHMLADPAWGPHIDTGRVGVAGHSQGGFTALWIGGARINPERFLAFQQRFIDDPRIPASIRRDLPLDATPALTVADDRVKAVFAMAPGVIQAFGMDPDGLRALQIPAYLIVGARDTQTPPEENAVFAARFIPHAQLRVLPGLVDHEIFTNECDQEGRNEFPEACVDVPGVDRHALHDEIATAALTFFGRTMPAR